MIKVYCERQKVSLLINIEQEYKKTRQVWWSSWKWLNRNTERLRLLCVHATAPKKERHTSPKEGGVSVWCSNIDLGKRIGKGISKGRCRKQMVLIEVWKCGKWVGVESTKGKCRTAEPNMSVDAHAEAQVGHQWMCIFVQVDASKT